MERRFVPKKTVTIQMNLLTHDKMMNILKDSQLTKTKLFEKLINDEYKKKEEKIC